MFRHLVEPRRTLDNEAPAGIPGIDRRGFTNAPFPADVEKGMMLDLGE